MKYTNIYNKTNIDCLFQAIWIYCLKFFSRIILPCGWRLNGLYQNFVWNTNITKQTLTTYFEQFGSPPPDDARRSCLHRHRSTLSIRQI